jgi:hypothetical protein
MIFPNAYVNTISTEWLGWAIIIQYYYDHYEIFHKIRLYAYLWNERRIKAIRYRNHDRPYPLLPTNTLNIPETCAIWHHR